VDEHLLEWIMASIIGSGINGNLKKDSEQYKGKRKKWLLLLEVELMETQELNISSGQPTALMASIIGSGINGNLKPITH